ncbi:MAG: hypothetical protein IJZ46_00635 [Bacilli bacterium]|nr:hypothetical protein [Bacilli bacterium]
MEIKLSKRGLFLLIYAIIIIIALIYILFIAPDTMFLSKESKELLNKIEEKQEFTSIDKQIANLSNKDYKYYYNIMDSMTTKTYTYHCEGEITNTKDNGMCEEFNIKYNQDNKKEQIKNINHDYINPNKIYEMIKDIEPVIESYTDTKVYNYKLKIKELNTDITIITGYENINEIRVTNAYMAYVIKYIYA